MGLFDKKYCDICGEKIRFLGNRKLNDGNMCKDCAEKLSPWLSGRRGMTVADIQAHMNYRADNYDQLQYFNPTRVIGTNMKLYIDDNQGLLFFSRNSNWRNSNPDLIRFDQITGVQIDIDETRHQREVVTPPPPPPPQQGGIGQGRPGVQPPRPQPPRQTPPAPQPPRPQPPRQTPPAPQPHGGPGAQRPGQPGPSGQRPGQGRPQGGQPQGGRPQGGHGGPGGRGRNMPSPAPRDPMVVQGEYYYTYDFNVIVYVNSEWFTEIRFRANSSSVEDSSSVAYQNAYAEAYQYKTTLEALAGSNYTGSYEQTASRTAVTCPYCGATTIPDANGCCEYCGGAVNG